MVVWLAVAVLFGLLIHELGHYICASIFGWNPKFGISKEGLQVSYHVHVEANKVKMVVTSFFGIIGVIPILLYCVFSASLLNHVFLVVLFIGYSLFETICRYRMVRNR